MKERSQFSIIFEKLVNINFYLFIILALLLFGRMLLTRSTGLPMYEGLSDTGISGFLKKHAPKEERINLKKWKGK